MYFEEGWFRGVVSEFHFIYTDQSEVVTKTRHSIDFEDGEDHLVKLEALEKKNELKWGWDDDERVKKEEPAASDGEEEGVKKEEPINGYDTDLEADLEPNSTNRKDTEEELNLARSCRLKKEEASMDEETGKSVEKPSQKRAATASLKAASKTKEPERRTTSMKSFSTNRRGIAEEPDIARAGRPKKEEASKYEDSDSSEKKPPQKIAAAASLKAAPKAKEKRPVKRTPSASSKPGKNSRKKAKLSIVVPRNDALPSRLTPNSGIDGILRYMDKMEPGEEYLQRQRTPRGGKHVPRGSRLLAWRSLLTVLLQDVRKLETNYESWPRRILHILLLRTMPLPRIGTPLIVKRSRT